MTMKQWRAWRRDLRYTMSDELFALYTYRRLRAYMRPRRRRR